MVKYLQFSIHLVETELPLLGLIVYFFLHVNCALCAVVLTIPLDLTFSTLGVVSVISLLSISIKNTQTISVTSFFHTHSAIPRLCSIHLFLPMFYLTSFFHPMKHGYMDDVNRMSFTMSILFWLVRA